MTIEAIAQLTDTQPALGLMPRLRTLYHGSIWLLEPDLVAMPAYADRRRALATLGDSDAILAKLDALEKDGPPKVDPLDVREGVAVIEVTGMLTKQPSLYRLLGCSTEATYGEIGAAVRRAASTPGVYSILLRVASPGGELFGLPEVGDAIYEARQAGIRVAAYIEDMGCSAAYWIASQAKEVMTNEVGHVGSVGVICILVDSSKAAEMEGLRFVPIASTPGKVGNRPGVPLSDEAIAARQGQLDRVGQRFELAVARGRRVDVAMVREKWHDARVHLGQDAVDIGLVDRVVPRVDEVFDELVRYGRDKAARQRRVSRI